MFCRDSRMSQRKVIRANSPTFVSPAGNKSPYIYIYIYIYATADDDETKPSASHTVCRSPSISAVPAARPPAIHYRLQHLPKRRRRPIFTMQPGPARPGPDQQRNRPRRRRRRTKNRSGCARRRRRQPRKATWKRIAEGLETGRIRREGE